MYVTLLIDSFKLVDNDSQYLSPFRENGPKTIVDHKI